MMFQPEIDRLVIRYKEFQRRDNWSRTNPYGNQSETNYCEEQMAKIESKFNISDLDINDYL